MVTTFAHSATSFFLCYFEKLVTHPTARPTSTVKHASPCCRRLQVVRCSMGAVVRQRVQVHEACAPSGNDRTQTCFVRRYSWIHRVKSCVQLVSTQIPFSKGTSSQDYLYTWAVVHGHVQYPKGFNRVFFHKQNFMYS